MSTSTTTTTSTSTSTTIPVTSTSASSTTSTTAPSTYETIKTGASNAAATVSAAAQSLAAETKKQYHQMTAHPTTMTCSKCATVMMIPPTVWDSLPEATPVKSSWPALTCTKCGTLTPVPSTEVNSVLKGSLHTVQAGINSMTQTPETFHCHHCSTSLLRPTGKWQCQTCTTHNDEKAPVCSQCAQSLYDNKVLCGQCGRSTTVPKSGLIDAARSSMHKLESGARRVWLSVTGAPHAICPACDSAVSLPNGLSNRDATNPADTQTTGEVYRGEVLCKQCHTTFEVGGPSHSISTANPSAGNRLVNIQPMSNDNSTTIGQQQSVIENASNEWNKTGAISTTEKSETPEMTHNNLAM